MKIERINDSQMKFILTKTDLDKRCLDVADLAYGSTKTQELFQDIIDTACKEFSFNMEDTPLMIDAVPTSKTSIMIILTKVTSPVSLQEVDGKIKKVNNNNNDFIPLSPQMIDEDVPNREVERKSKRILKNLNDRCLIYSFDSMDEISEIAGEINSRYVDSSLYKYNGKYILCVSVKKENYGKIQYIDCILSEYGQKLKGEVELVVAYMKENGELLIKKNALSIIEKF